VKQRAALELRPDRKVTRLGRRPNKGKEKSKGQIDFREERQKLKEERGKKAGQL